MAQATAWLPIPIMAEALDEERADAAEAEARTWSDGWLTAEDRRVWR